MKIVVLALAMGLALTPAWADSTATSRIAQIKVQAPSHEAYELFHGALWLAYDKAEHNYRWGGKHCPGVDLSVDQVQLLFDSLRAKFDVTVDFAPKTVKGEKYRCITGFTVSRP